MAELKKVLCPVDLTPDSQSAVEEAAELAQKLGAELLLVHVLSEPAFAMADPLLAPGEVSAFAQPVVTEDYVEVMDRRLSDLGDVYRARGLAVSTMVLRGTTDEAIVDAADDAHADIIVMRTHGRTGLSHFLLGSVTERVVRTAKVPVMTLRPH